MSEVNYKKFTYLELENIIQELEDKLAKSEMDKTVLFKARLEKARREKARRDDNITHEALEEVVPIKTVVKRKTWIVELIDYSDNTSVMNRTNDGFTLLELRGLAELLSDELLQQFKGTIKPDVINRKVIVDGN